ncbi:hypothetical protein RhiirA4_528548 [Rhizophagus irregularis]|uniref:Uncharacterized protein n=1 Tax=Rhizophagus irregularis TaxID=588596 RepID=A0A2I1GT56_9GLOM|nr:hypothetical protein RhiirA4_528548 [Rhizophagus irregularis]
MKSGKRVYGVHVVNGCELQRSSRIYSPNPTESDPVGALVNMEEKQNDMGKNYSGETEETDKFEKFCDAFNKAKEDGKHGLLIFRSELINDYERLYGADLYKSLQSSKYICFRQDQNLMKKWLEKSKEIREEELYPWFDEDTSNK